MQRPIVRPIIRWLHITLVLACVANACTSEDTIVAPLAQHPDDRRPVVRIAINPEVTLTDPLVVRRGFMTMAPFSVARAVFEGKGFRIELEGIEPGALGPESCAPCILPGVLQPGLSFIGSMMGAGPTTVGDHHFDFLHWEGGIELTSDPLLLTYGRAHGVVVAPVQLSAFLSGYLISQTPGASDPQLVVQLVGEGDLKITFDVFDAGFEDNIVRVAIWRTLEYTFRPSRSGR